jgi:hypothetical protein
LFGPSSGEPFRLPDYDLQVVDARGLIDSDYGRLAFKADGAGALRDGFAGTIAALVPEAHVGGCALGRASLYGRVVIEGERPRFSGPLRLAGAQCVEQGAALGAATVQVDARADRDFAGATVQAKLRSGALALPSAQADALTFDAAMAYRNGMLSGGWWAMPAGFTLRARRLHCSGWTDWCGRAMVFAPWSSAAMWTGRACVRGRRSTRVLLRQRHLPLAR